MAAAPPPPKPWHGGQLVFTGGTDWARLGRTINKKDKDDESRTEVYPDLRTPHRLGALSGVKIQFVSVGSSAVHILCGDVDGRLFSWGRNEKGQLGHGDLCQRNVPTIVAALEGKKAIAAATGRNHSVVVTEDGESYACGLNNNGQLGVGSVKRKGKEDDVYTKPTKVVLSAKATAAACGIDFTLWIADGKLYGAGNPQYGQLGDGSDHQYNTKDSSIAMAYEPIPTPKLVPSLSQKTVTRIACGLNHSICVDSEGSCYTWGNGGYGRLGHREQKDSFAPKKVEEFRGRISVPADAVIAASSTATFSTTAPTGQLYYWGKLKTSGDNQMYPRTLDDMSGWHVRSMACGPGTFVIAADTSVVTWGQASNGELGYGENGKKSSANPDKCLPLEGVHVQQVSAGVGFMCFLADPENDKVGKLPLFETKAPEAEEAAPVPEEGAEGGGKGKGGAKRKAEPAAAAAKGKKAK